MRNYVQPGERITLTAAAAASSGDPVLIGTHLFGVAFGDAGIGDKLTLATAGVYTLPKVATDVFTVGLPVYFDAAEGVVTTDDDSSANPQVGVAVTAAGNPSSAVDVKLLPVAYLPEPAET